MNVRMIILAAIVIGIISVIYFYKIVKNEFYSELHSAIAKLGSKLDAGNRSEINGQRIWKIAENRIKEMEHEFIKNISMAQKKIAKLMNSTKLN